MLELSAYGLDFTTGRVDALDPRSSPDIIARLIELLETYQTELHAILSDRSDADLEAIRKEASTR
jgi:hypothetical protein